jgi:hypothetical protein
MLTPMPISANIVSILPSYLILTSLNIRFTFRRQVK